MSTNNYKLNCQFGAHPAGAVVPAHVVEVGHDVELLLARGLVEPTAAPTTVALVAPEVAKAAPPDSVEKERDRLAAENAALRKANAEAVGTAKELERERDAYKRKCDEYTAKIVHLEDACEEHQTRQDEFATENGELKAALEKLKAENAQIHADLEAATAPAKPKA